jgi:hypothetical protein
MVETQVAISWRPGLGSCPGGVEFAGLDKQGGVIVRLLSTDRARVICAALDLLGNGHSWTNNLVSALAGSCTNGAGKA